MTQPRLLRAGHYFLGIEGLAMVRKVWTDRESATARASEMFKVVARFDEFPNTLEIPLVEHDLDAGYTEWSTRYDGPNPAIEGEQPVVHEILASLPVGDALDAACGTGRHAQELRALGHRVIGVDANAGMLAVAREKLPDVDLREGHLEALPLDDDSVDVVTCSLALTHVEELEPVMREFARVLRSGGTAVLSDIHPYNTILGGSLAAFPGDDITNGIPYVINRTHLTSEYLRAFRVAGLLVDDCIELPFGERQMTALPAYAVFPEAVRQAFDGVPYLLIWRLRRA